MSKKPGAAQPGESGKDSCKIVSMKRASKVEAAGYRRSEELFCTHFSAFQGLRQIFYVNIISLFLAPNSISFDQKFNTKEISLIPSDPFNREIT